MKQPLATLSSDPPTLTVEEIRAAMEEGAKAARAFMERTRGMHMARGLCRCGR